MSAGHADRLFVTIVVIGSALGSDGCFGKVRDEEPNDAPTEDGNAEGAEEAAGATAGSATASSPTSAAGMDLERDATVRVDPTLPEHCAYAAQFACDSYDDWPYTGCRCVEGAPRDASECTHPQQFICATPSGWDCRCDPTAPLTPSACEHPQQFLCHEYETPTGPMGCVCNPAAPLSPTQCTGRAEWTCYSYDPPTGCECIDTILIQ